MRHLHFPLYTTTPHGQSDSKPTRQRFRVFAFIPLLVAGAVVGASAPASALPEELTEAALTEQVLPIEPGGAPTRTGITPTVNAALNLGGLPDGRFADSTGTHYDGTGTLIVDIDGAFVPTVPALAGRVARQQCIGQLTTSFPSLCERPALTGRSNSALGSYLTGESVLPSNGTIGSDPRYLSNTCREAAVNGGTQPCHTFHGTATAGLAAGQAATIPGTGIAYGGIARGARLELYKIGGGNGSVEGWPGQSIVDALNDVAGKAAASTSYRPAAVTISTNGLSVAQDSACTAGSIGAQIDQIAHRLRGYGIPVIMSAGNDAATGTGAWTCGTDVLVAAATEVDRPGTLTPYSNASAKVDFLAPVGQAVDGNAIASSSYTGGSTYVWGTSFANPQIAGAFAVLRQKFGNSASLDSLIEKLQTTSTQVTGTRSDQIRHGVGVIDIAEALG